MTENQSETTQSDTPDNGQPARGAPDGNWNAGIKHGLRSRANCRYAGGVIGRLRGKFAYVDRLCEAARRELEDATVTQHGGIDRHQARLIKTFVMAYQRELFLCAVRRLRLVEDGPPDLDVEERVSEAIRQSVDQQAEVEQALFPPAPPDPMALFRRTVHHAADVPPQRIQFAAPDDPPNPPNETPRVANSATQGGDEPDGDVRSIPEVRQLP